MNLFLEHYSNTRSLSQVLVIFFSTSWGRWSSEDLVKEWDAQINTSSSRWEFQSFTELCSNKESLTMLLNIKDACKLVTYQTCKLQKCQSLFFMRGARVGKWWQHSSPTNMACAWILALRPFVGWISCWFSPLLMRFFSEFPGFLLSLNTAKFQFDLECMDMFQWVL